MTPTTLEIVAAILFALALIHTFSTKFFESMAHRQPAHAGLWHLLGEVEVVFGLWAMALIVAMVALVGGGPALAYLEGQNFTEPMFVFAIMVVAASRPILRLAMRLVALTARAMPLPGQVGYYLVTLSLVPLLGSFITEPAAMTLAALILLDRFYRAGISTRLMYATLGVLFVNISIGGTLTPFAAPPVLMVAGKWNWDFAFMAQNFGWKAMLAVFVNAIAVTALSWRELARLPVAASVQVDDTPATVTAIHLAFLAGVVVFAHHAIVFMGLLLFFIGFCHAYTRYQDKLILREGLLVGFFLAGLVVLGGQQRWWLAPLLDGLTPVQMFLGATALTAITDNAALTYLGSLVEGLPHELRYALVAGAVTGGGLTVIANAPNPAGFSLLKESFPGQAINPLGLLAAALLPTLVAGAAFLFL